jgi:4-aminobutyrate aminotransferase-like enzyme
VKSSELNQRRQQATPRGVGVMCNYFVEKAENATLWDIEGNEVIDFAAGIAVLNTGHRHPKIVAAVEQQLQAFTHTAYQIVRTKAMSRWRSVLTIWRRLTVRQKRRSSPPGRKRLKTR